MGEEKDRGKCMAPSATYRVDCTTCKVEVGKKASYWGETGASAHCRSAWHQESMRNMKEDNAMVKHAVLHRGGEKPGGVGEKPHLPEGGA